MSFTFQVLGFLIVFGSIMFIAFVTTRYIGTKAGKTMKGRYINIVESISLGLDKQIHLVKVEEQFVLIASSGKSIEFLTALKLDNYETDGIQDTANLINFRNIFDKYLKSFKNKDNPTSETVAALDKQSEEDAFKNNLNRLKSINQRLTKQDKYDGNDGTNEK